MHELCSHFSRILLGHFLRFEVDVGHPGLMPAETGGPGDDILGEPPRDSLGVVHDGRICYIIQVESKTLPRQPRNIIKLGQIESYLSNWSVQIRCYLIKKNQFK